jgi:hypothetical protein
MITTKRIKCLVSIIVMGVFISAEGWSTAFAVSGGTNVTINVMDHVILNLGKRPEPIVNGVGYKGETESLTTLAARLAPLGAAENAWMVRGVVSNGFVMVSTSPALAAEHCAFSNPIFSAEKESGRTSLVDNGIFRITPAETAKSCGATDRPITLTVTIF